MGASQFSCPKCGTVMRTSADLSKGATIRCPKCQQIIKLQASGSPPAPVKSIPSPPPKTVQATPPKPPPAPPKRPQPIAEAVKPKPQPKAPAKGQSEKGSRKGLLIGAIAGGVAVLGLGIFAVIAANGNKQPDPTPIVRNDPPPSDNKDDGGTASDPVKPSDKELIKDAVKVKPHPNQEGLSREVLNKVKKATVYIKVTDSLGRQATGSGFFAMSDDLVLTNAHVVGMLDEGSKPPRRVEVVLNSGLRDEKSASASVVTVDRVSDLAVLRVAPAKDVTWPARLQIGTAGDLRETQKVYVIGYPFGEQLGKNVTVSSSSISSFRTNKFGNLDQVQVNGGMNPGNSGGPVIDEEGNVIGVAVAGIRNTQINFAIPGEHVQTLTRGRISGIVIREPQLKDGKLIVYMKIELIDPLRSINSVAIDWWFGDSGPGRGPADSQPALLPTDGPRTTTKCNYNAATGAAEADLPLGTLPEGGKALWYQPSMVDATGKQHWVAASSKVQAKPVEAEPAVLEREITPSRVQLDVRSTADFTLKGSGESLAVHKNIVARFWEDVRRVEPDGTVMTYLAISDKFEVGYSINNKPPPPSPRFKQIIQDVGKLGLIVVSSRGEVTRQKMTDTSRVPQGSRAVLSAMADQLHDSYDLGNLPLPAGELKPGQTWRGLKTVPIDLMDDEAVRGQLQMTYTYRGVRNSEAGKLAVIHMAGILNGFKGRNTSLRGEARGEAVFDLATRRLIDVHVRTEVNMQIRFADDIVQAKGTLASALVRGKVLPLPANLPPINMIRPGGGNPIGPGGDPIRPPFPPPPQ